MIRYLAIISFIIIFTFSFSTKAEIIEINYLDLPHYIKTKNKKIKAKKYLVNAYDKQTDHLVKSFLPDINVTGGMEYFKTRDIDFRTDPKINLSASINLFNGGKDFLEDKIRNYRYEISKLDLRNEYLEELTLARYLFVNSNYYQSQIKLIEKTIINLKELYQKTNQQFESGLTTSTSLDAIKIYQAELQAELILIEEEFEHTLDELKITLGLDLNRNLKLTQKHHHLSFRKISYQNNPSLEILKNEIEVSKIKSEKYSRWWTPSLEVFSFYQLATYREREFFDYQYRDDYVTGFKVTIPLFDKLESNSKNQSEKMKMNALKEEYDYFDQELQANIKKLEHGLEVRDNLVHRFKDTLKLTENYLKKLKIEYLNGIKSSEDIISGFDGFLKKSYQYHQYLRDYSIFEAKLLALLDEDIK